jgi:hypothetical protein
MAYSIRLPDGTLVRNIPDELSPEGSQSQNHQGLPSVRS